jgi:hypothetical protein
MTHPNLGEQMRDFSSARFIFSCCRFRYFPSGPNLGHKLPSLPGPRICLRQDYGVE